MPPGIALVLCALFVLLIFRLASEKTRGASPSLWIPTIWILYCASRPVGAWLHPDSSGGQPAEEGSAVDRVLLCIFIAIGCLILKNRNLNWAKVFRDNRWLVLLCGYMAMSIVWSDYNFVSLKRWFRFCATPLMALIVLTESSPREAMEKVFRRTAYLWLPVSLLLIKYYPDLGMQYDLWTGERMWVGVTTQKNGLGRLCLISAFFLVWAIIRAWSQRKQTGVKWRIRTDVAVLLLALLLLRGPGGAYSATSIVALLLGTTMYLGLLWMRKLKSNTGVTVLMIVIGISIFLGIVIPIIGGSGASGFAAILGRDATFTGRTDIWQAILPVALRNSVLGVGYGSFWIKPPISYNLFIMVNEAHNGYLDVFVELGLVGLILFLGFLLSSCRAAQRALAVDFEWAGFVLCFLLVIVIHNITESSFLRPTNHMGATLFFLAMLIHRLRKAGVAPGRNARSAEIIGATPFGQEYR